MNVQKFTRTSRVALAVLMGVSAVSVGFAGVVLATPAAEVTETPGGSNPGQETFVAPASGFINSTSGQIYALGVGSLSNTDTDFERDRQSWASRHFDGTITGVDRGRWILEAEYLGTIKAKSHYVPTGLFPQHEPYWVQAKGRVEIHGDFGDYGFERWVHASKDGPELAKTAYSTTSSTGTYNFSGMKSQAVPDEDDGIALDQDDWGWKKATYTVTGDDIGAGVPIDFKLYVRAWHKLHTFEEEDVSLSTSILANTNPEGTPIGWKGTLKAYDVVGFGAPVLLDTWPFGN